jgi:DNA-binding XRE family transcriptional regulator
VSAPSRPAGTPLPVLMVDARQALQLNQADLAVLVGSSQRTVQRWETARTTPAPWHIQRLAEAVRALEPALASDLDKWAPPDPARTSKSLEPPPPAPPPATPTPVLVEAIVCAAAEAIGIAPQAVRPALIAAFARARDLGLTPDAIVGTLAPRPSEREAKSAKRRR